MNSIKPISFEELKNNPIEENKIEDKSKEKEIEKGNLENISNEVRVFPKSSISSLLDHCEKILSYQKLKELKMSASGDSISKLIVLVEILKSKHPGMTYNTSLSSEKGERGMLSPKIDLILSQGGSLKKEHEALSEEDRKKLLDIWENEKQRKNNNNNIVQRRPMNNNNMLQRRPVNNNNININNNNNNGWNFNRRGFQNNNNNRNMFVNNRGFRYGNNWQMNGYRNVRNFNWRNFSGNWNNDNRRNYYVNK